jgi:hypothetical protein
MRIMWDLQTKLGSADPVRGLEMAVALMSDEPVVAKVSAPSSAPMSLTAMRNFNS